MSVIPMIHVPDVQATVAWYEAIGFVTRAVHQEPGCPMDWASLVYGASEIMLSAGGRLSQARRREVDLYVRTDDLDRDFRAISPKAELIEGIHVTHHGMREFIVRDLNDRVTAN